MGGGEAGRRPRERLAATEDELAVAEGKDNRERESERECVRECGDQDTCRRSVRKLWAELWLSSPWPP